MCMGRGLCQRAWSWEWEQQPERPVEAAEYRLERVRSILEPPGQDALEYKGRPKPNILIPRAKTPHTVEITTVSRTQTQVDTKACLHFVWTFIITHS